MWAQGWLHGRYIKRSLKTVSWEKAEQVKNVFEGGTESAVVIETAIKTFLDDSESRHLHDATIRKYRVLLNRLQSHLQSRGLRFIAAVNTQDLRSYRSQWRCGPRTAQKNTERLRSFFRFCHETGWTTKNPAAPLKNPVIKQNPTLPFSPEEVQRIIHACPDDFILAFVLMLLYTGMRISDAALLMSDKIQGQKIFLYTHKTGVPVYVPIPDYVAGLIQRIQTDRRGYE